MRQFYYRLCIWLGVYKREDFVTAWSVVNAAYNRYRKIPEFVWMGLCQALVLSLREVAGVHISYSEVPRYIFKFNPKFLGAKVNKRKSSFWWPDLTTAADAKQAYTLRLKALEKLLDYYAEHEVLIKKGKRL